MGVQHAEEEEEKEEYNAMRRRSKQGAGGARPCSTTAVADSDDHLACEWDVDT